MIGRLLSWRNHTSLLLAISKLVTKHIANKVLHGNYMANYFCSSLNGDSIWIHRMYPWLHTIALPLYLASRYLDIHGSHVRSFPPHVLPSRFECCGAIIRILIIKLISALNRCGYSRLGILFCAKFRQRASFLSKEAVFSTV